MASLIKKPQVLKKTALSNSSLYRLITAGEFPAPIQLGPRAVAWDEQAVDDWIEARIEASLAAKVAS